MGKRRHVASGRLYRGCPWLRLGPQEARAAPPPASCLELFRRGRAALRQAAAALPHTWCACRAAFRQRVPVKHAADRRLRGRKVIGLPARARHDERRAPPWPVRSRAYHLKSPIKSPLKSPVDPVGFDPRAQWDSTRGPERFDRECGPIRLLIRRSNRLFRRLFDRASNRPVEPRCAHHTTPHLRAHKSSNAANAVRSAPRIEPPIGRAIGLMRAKASSSAFGRLTLAPFSANFGPHWPYWKPNFGPH